MKYFQETYGNGLFFGTKLAENIDATLKRIKMKKASCIIIDGGIGEGKTTLAIQVADYINRKAGLPEVDLTNPIQLALGGKEFVDKLNQCWERKLPCIIYDEAGDFSRYGALTQFNSQINRIFEVYRAFQIVVIICIPTMYLLESRLFHNKIPRMLLHCYGRTKSYGCIKGYSYSRMNRLRQYMRKLQENMQMAYSLTDWNFMDKFKNLVPERDAQLNKLTVDSKMDIVKDSQARLEGLMNLAEIGRMVNRSRNHVRLLLKQLNVPHKKMIKNVYYWDEEAVRIINEFHAGGGVLEKTTE